MNIVFLDQHQKLSTTFTPGFYTEIVRHVRVLIVFPIPWLRSDPKMEHPQQVSPNLWVVRRRVFAPYRYLLKSKCLAKMDAIMLDRSLERYARELSWSPDILESASPQFYAHLKCRTGRKKVFWLVDHYSQIPGIDPKIAELTVYAEHKAVQNADFTLATANELVNRFSRDAKIIRFIPNAADHNHYQPLWMRPTPEPEALQKLKRPVFGFVGNVNPVSNWALLYDLANEHPEYTFAIFGGKNGPSDFYQSGIFPKTMELPNVHYMGLIPQEELPNYIAHFDVGLVLDPINEFSKTVNHNKMYQYLLCGIPVTGTNFTPDYQPFSKLLHLFDDPREWSKLCEDALAARDETSSKRRRAFAEKMSWEANIALRMKMYEALLEERELPTYRFPTVD